MLIIDTHVHIGRGEQLSDSYQIDCDADTILSAMKEAGVDKTCIMPVAYRDYENAIQEVRAAAAAHPEQLIPFARANLRDEERAVPQLRRCLEEYGFRGVKIHPDVDGFPTRSIMALLSDGEVPLLLHAPAEPRIADAITHLARSYPRVPVICGHMGSFGSLFPTFVKYYATEARGIANLYLDTAFVLLHQWIREAVEICGPDKVLFASDGPVGHPALVLKQIELCHFSEAENEIILGANAKKLLRL